MLDQSTEDDLLNIQTSFLEKARVSNEREAMTESIKAALAHNPTYLPGATDDDRQLFRNSLATQLRTHSKAYAVPVSDSLHLENIQRISDELSRGYAQTLRGSRLRIGTTQKALNLYLKFLWCLDLTRAVPPHCPVDRIVLKAAGIDEAWTQLDCPDTYMAWVQQCGATASSKEFSSIQHWELSLWNTLA